MEFSPDDSAGDSAGAPAHSRPLRGSQSICLPFESRETYEACLHERTTCRTYLEEMHTRHPELFPVELGSGFIFHGYTSSRKQSSPQGTPFRMRRIKLTQTGAVYQLRPSFMMPYMVATTEEVEKGLYLRRWGVPFEALAYVLGRNPMFWYRAFVSLGRPSLVGTTVKDATHLPQHLLADEKHTWLQGEPVYLVTTVAKECLLGAALAERADTESLSQAYQEFAQEAHQLDPDYAPKTVNTDGWEPTQNAWKRLFPAITVLLCFLHAFLKIRDRCKRDQPLLQCLRQKVWHAYHAPTRAAFSQRLRRFREWTHAHLDPGPVYESVLKLCQQAPRFRQAFRHPGAYRTSNALDRLMNYQDRVLYAAQYLHGTKQSARLYARAMAMLWNFHPYGARTQAMYPNRASPFEALNGFRYHDNWLQNLMVAASIGGRDATT